MRLKTLEFIIKVILIWLDNEIVIMDVTEKQTCEPNHLQNLERQFN